MFLIALGLEVRAFIHSGLIQEVLKMIRDLSFVEVMSRRKYENSLCICCCDGTDKKTG